MSVPGKSSASCSRANCSIQNASTSKETSRREYSSFQIQLPFIRFSFLTWLKQAAEESEDEEAQSEEELPRGTQRQRARARAEESDEESGPDLDAGIAREELEIPGEGDGKNQFVKKLVRYALACEYARLPIKRDGIKDKGCVAQSMENLCSC